MPNLVPATPTGLAVSAGYRILPTLLRWGFVAAVVGGSYLLFKKLIREIKKSNLLKNVGENSKDGLAIGYATRLYTAMISGPGWWSDWVGDGTDEEAIYQVAREMHTQQVSFALVSSSYKTLYGRELLPDLTGELSTAEMRMFQNILMSGLGNVVAPLEIQVHMLVTTAPAMVLNGEFTPVSPVAAGIRLGPETEALVLPDRRVFLGFTYQNQPRYVPAEAVQRLPLN